MHKHLILAGLIAVGAAVANARAEITADEFERLHKEIRPRSGEGLWTEIPWMYDLVKARKKAAELGKPLCVWRMAGDPTAVC